MALTHYTKIRGLYLSINEKYLVIYSLLLIDQVTRIQICSVHLPLFINDLKIALKVLLTCKPNHFIAQSSS